MRCCGWHWPKREAGEASLGERNHTGVPERTPVTIVATEAFALPTTAISAVPPAALPASAAAEPVKDGAAPHGLIAAAKWAATDGVTGANFRMFCAGSVMPSPGAAQRAWDEWCAELKDWSARGAPPLSARSSKLAGGGCEIAETALRGITLKQLRAVYGQACEACRAERWRSYDRASKSWTGAAEIVPDALTLYELVQYWLKPQTEALECSMVELLADGPQPPRYFVSHWWGEAVKDFIACVDVHVHDHRHIGVDENTPYWVCAYANNQHRIGSELEGGVMVSPFVRALNVSDGMVTITDKEGVVLTRVWCGFEAYVATLQRGAQFAHDIYVAGDFRDRGNASRGAVGFVSGYAADDVGYEGTGKSQYKAHREAPFPKRLAEVAASFDISGADASEEADKVAIMNEVGADAARLNATVRARYSISLLPELLEGRDPPRLAAYCSALAASELRSLFLVCPRWHASAEAARQVGNALPASLAELDADGIGTGAVGGIAARIAQGKLLRLTLRFCCLDPAEGSLLAAALGERGARLRELNLTWNRLGVEGASALARCLEVNTTLTHLDLEDNKLGAEGASALAKCLECHNTSLKILNLSVNGVGDEGASALARCLERNTTLTSLILEDNGVGAEGASALARCLEHRNTSLTNLDLGSNDVGVEGASALARCQERNTTLTSLNLRNHHAARCDVCRVTPLVGSRYKCAECPDYDLCESCYATSAHDEHAFGRLRTRGGQYEQLPARGVSTISFK